MWIFCQRPSSLLRNCWNIKTFSLAINNKKTTSCIICKTYFLISSVLWLYLPTDSCVVHKQNHRWFPLCKFKQVDPRCLIVALITVLLCNVFQYLCRLQLSTREAIFWHFDLKSVGTAACLHCLHISKLHNIAPSVTQ